MINRLPNSFVLSFSLETQFTVMFMLSLIWKNTFVYIIPGIIIISKYWKSKIVTSELFLSSSTAFLVKDYSWFLISFLSLYTSGFGRHWFSFNIRIFFSSFFRRIIYSMIFVWIFYFWNLIEISVFTKKNKLYWNQP